MNATTVRLRPEIARDLDEIAATSRRSRSWLINEALRNYIRTTKAEQARWEETVHAMESVAKGRVASGEAVHAWLKTWGSADERKPPKSGA